MGIGADHAFGGELRCRVQRGLDRERHILGRREDLWLAVYRTRRREGDLGRSDSAHGLEDGRGRDRVLLEIASRMLESETHVRVCLQVKDPVTPVEGPLE